MKQMENPFSFSEMSSRKNSSQNNVPYKRFDSLDLVKVENVSRFNANSGNKLIRKL